MMYKRDLVENRRAVVECRSVSKYFGETPPASIDAISKGGCDKDELLSRFGLVVAVNNVSLSVYEGETFCIMGLSGCGKSTLIRHFNRMSKRCAGAVVIKGQAMCTRGNDEARKL